MRMEGRIRILEAEPRYMPQCLRQYFKSEGFQYLDGICLSIFPHLVSISILQYISDIDIHYYFSVSATTL